MNRTIRIANSFVLALFLLALPAGLAAQDAEGVPAEEVATDEQADGGAEKKKSGFDFQKKLNHHLMDAVIFEFHPGGTRVYAGPDGFEKPPMFVKEYTFYDENGAYRYEGGVPMHLTRRVMMMIVVSIIMMILLLVAARQITRNPYRINGRLGNILEAAVGWLRRDVTREGMHEHARGFEPYVFTLFFFILFLNLAGLFPPIGEGLAKIVESFSATEHADHGGHHGPHPVSAIWPGITVTGDVSVTFSLAVIVMVMMWVTGFRYQGPGFVYKAVPDGVPWPLYVIMWPLEFVVSPIAKSFALTIRLLANMTGGHVLILAIMGFIFQVSSLWYMGVGPAIGAAGITLASVFGAVAIYFLEILVGFLQAFIFAILTSLFIGSVMHRH